MKAAQKPSAARQRLAEAIGVMRQAETDRAALDTLLTNGRLGFVAMETARKAVTEAESALAAAKSTTVDNLLDGSTSAGPSIADARHTLGDARDQLEALQTARQEAERRLDAVPSLIDRHRGMIELAAIDVLREEAGPSIAGLVAELDGLHRQIAEKGLLLDWLTGRVVPDRGPAAPTGLMEVNARFHSMPRTWVFSEPTRSPTVKAWNAALEGLKTDALAALPDLA